jgi:hypothetical protein
MWEVNVSRAPANCDFQGEPKGDNISVVILF